MNILALDSSSPVVSVAFVTAGVTESSVHFLSNQAHKRSDSAALFEALQAAVTSHGLPDALCVGLGPGSYNGLRAGIATARAMATALEIPMFALPSPLALPGPDSGFWAVGDARGGHTWIACVLKGAFLEQPRLVPALEITASFQIHPDFPILASAPMPGIENLQLLTPCAGLLAIAAKKADPIAGTPEPLYLKPPHITPPRMIPAGI
jgi:tRNA threonylcarbamoyladenosine biosynthesis protein TsaB